MKRLPNGAFFSLSRNIEMRLWRGVWRRSHIMDRHGRSSRRTTRMLGRALRRYSSLSLLRSSRFRGVLLVSMFRCAVFLSYHYDSSIEVLPFLVLMSPSRYLLSIGMPWRSDPTRKHACSPPSCHILLHVFLDSSYMSPVPPGECAPLQDSNILPTLSHLLSLA